jgi:phage gpG-like protein
MKGFHLRFEIEGVPELSRVLMMEYKKVTDFSTPLKQASKFILADIEQNFISEGGLVGGWTPLSQSTILGRIREGYGGAHPILQKTGKLRKSFFSKVSKNKTMITSTSPYFPYHQSRSPRTKLPRRAMLVLTERTKQNIVQSFNSFLRFK